MTDDVLIRKNNEQCFDNIFVIYTVEKWSTLNISHDNLSCNNICRFWCKENVFLKFDIDVWFCHFDGIARDKHFFPNELMQNI